MDFPSHLIRLNCFNCLCLSPTRGCVEWDFHDGLRPVEIHTPELRRCQPLLKDADILRKVNKIRVLIKLGSSAWPDLGHLKNQVTLSDCQFHLPLTRGGPLSPEKNVLTKKSRPTKLFTPLKYTALTSTCLASTGHLATNHLFKVHVPLACSLLNTGRKSPVFLDALYKKPQGFLGVASCCFAAAWLSASVGKFL